MTLIRYLYNWHVIRRLVSRLNGKRTNRKVEESSRNRKRIN